MKLGESNRQMRGPNRENEEKTAFLSLDFTWIILTSSLLPYHSAKGCGKRTAGNDSIALLRHPMFVIE